jgi:hypothetical protein
VVVLTYTRLQLQAGDVDHVIRATIAMKDKSGEFGLQQTFQADAL